MERFLPRIWVFVLTFGLGISMSAIWRIYTLPAYVPARPEAVIELPDYSIKAVLDLSYNDGEPRLISENHSCGASANGQRYHYTDGGWVGTKCRRFKSSAAAARELANRKRDATIAEQSITIDTSDNSVGEELLIKAPTIVRLRKTGRLLCEVEASSLKHLHLFEKRLN